MVHQAVEGILQFGLNAASSRCYMLAPWPACGCKVDQLLCSVVAKVSKRFCCGISVQKQGGTIASTATGSGARLTPAANATLLVNLVPVVTPVMLYFLANEAVTSREILGTIVSISGAVYLSYHDFDVSTESFRGDLVCVLSAVLYALYFVLGRRNRRQASVLLYVTPLYLAAGVFCFITALFFTEANLPASWRDAGCILGLALIPTVIGHSLINNSVRFLRGQLVSVIGQTQIFFAALLAFLLLGEVPAPTIYPAAGLVVAGCALILLRKRQEPGLGEPAGE